MGNRMIKETIRTSRSVNSMTDFQFRVWVYLITYVDDYGRGSADPELLKGLVFPRRKRLTESDLKKALADLAGMGCIRLYQVDGESYFCFPNWGKHQRIQSKRSRFPTPDESENFGDSPKVTESYGGFPPERELETNIETELETEGETNARTRAKDPPAQKYGEYQNVLLSDDDLEKLKAEFPSDWEARINRLSEYIASTGKKYKNHLATIRAWARKDAETPAQPVKPSKVGRYGEKSWETSYDIEEFERRGLMIPDWREEEKNHEN